MCPSRSTGQVSQIVQSTLPFPRTHSNMAVFSCLCLSHKDHFKFNIMHCILWHSVSRHLIMVDQHDKETWYTFLLQYKFKIGLSACYSTYTYYDEVCVGFMGSNTVWLCTCGGIYCFHLQAWSSLKCRYLPT
jgi:hypothetical protein